MNLMEKLTGKWTIIIGDINTGKTTLTEHLLEKAIEEGCSPITVLDFAPLIHYMNGTKIGGSIRSPTSPKLRILKSNDIEAPRLTGRSFEEVMRIAERNFNATRALLRTFAKSPHPLLFINDLTIYLHIGTVDELLRNIRMAQTVVANGYYGKYFSHDFQTEISCRERFLMESLIQHFDFVIDLNEAAQQDIGQGVVMPKWTSKFKAL